MADSGFNWDDSWAFVQKSASNWDDDALADEAEETSDVIDLDGKAVCNISIEIVEDNTGAIDGDLEIYILGDVDGTNFEERSIGNPRSFNIAPIQNDIVRTSFSVMASDYPKFKLSLYNDAGQELAIDVRIKYATIPAAS